MHAFYIKHQAEQNRRPSAGGCVYTILCIRLGIGPPHNLQHQAPPHYVLNSCILNIFIETISIYILGLRRTTHLIDAIQKYYHYSRVHAYVCVLVRTAYALAPEFRVFNCLKSNFRQFQCSRYHLIRCLKFEPNSKRAHCGPRICRLGHDSHNCDATI